MLKNTGEYNIVLPKVGHLAAYAYVSAAQERPAPHWRTGRPGLRNPNMAAHARQPIAPYAVIAGPGFAASARPDPIIPLAAYGGAQLLAPPLPPVRGKSVREPRRGLSGRRAGGGGRGQAS